MRNFIHIIVFFWVLFVSMPLYAQKNLKVKNFQESQDHNEQAYFAKKRLDPNEKICDADNHDRKDDCALIVIEMLGVKEAEINPKFSSEYKNGKYYVYVSKDVKTIYIYTGEYEKLIYRIPEPLELHKTYKMVIDVPRKELYYQAKWSLDASIIAGQAVGAEIDFTVSYFLIGIGADWFVGKTKGWMQKKTLYNSGYTGNFLREKTVSLSGTRTQLFANIGAYFRYVSVGCQVGVLFCQNSLTELSYSGNGVGIQDEYINQKWGEYAHYTLDKSIESKNKKYFTVAPTIKGYIPLKSIYCLTIGAGYTFIPAVSAGEAWGSVGLQVKFD